METGAPIARTAQPKAERNPLPLSLITLFRRSEGRLRHAPELELTLAQTLFIAKKPVVFNLQYMDVS